jgi:hypothetical protein
MAPIRVSIRPSEPEKSPIRQGSTTQFKHTSAPSTESKDEAQQSTSGDAAKRTTLVFVHGMGVQEAAPLLKRRFDEALFGRDVGERTRIAYWANILNTRNHRRGERRANLFVRLIHWMTF